MGDWLLAQGILPSRTSDQQAHTDKLGTPFLKTYVDALQTARPFPIVLDGSQITTDMQKQVEGVVKTGADPKVDAHQRRNRDQRAAEKGLRLGPSAPVGVCHGCHHPGASLFRRRRNVTAPRVERDHVGRPH